MAVLEGHTSVVNKVQMRGDTLLTYDPDGTIRIWSLEKRALLRTIDAHHQSAASLDFDGSSIISGPLNEPARIWDAQSGELMREFGSPADVVWKVALGKGRATFTANRGKDVVLEVKWCKS
ncbi:hypothetical protein LTR04_007182 [Oleoguttula sp. CCFEE 6159]|nr:hypothetical protein LTR04_007182 [Oleoguttula sp. CCFEE 6159]